MSDRYSELFKKAIGEYVSYLQLILECLDWRVVLLGTAPDSDDALASIDCTYGRKLANLALCKDFFDMSPETQRHALVHEITHILTDACDNVIRHGDISTVTGMPAYTVICASWVNAIEYLTDVLAYAFDELMVGRTRHDRLWENVLRAERDELPIPDPDTVIAGSSISAPP